MEDLLKAARTHVQKIVVDDTTVACLPHSAIAGMGSASSLEALIHDIDRPETTSSEEVRFYRYLSASYHADHDQTHARILAVEAYLRNPEVLLDAGSQVKESATILRRWTVSAILPEKAFAMQSEYDLGED